MFQGLQLPALQLQRQALDTCPTRPTSCHWPKDTSNLASGPWPLWQGEPRCFHPHSPSPRAASHTVTKGYRGHSQAQRSWRTKYRGACPPGSLRSSTHCPYRHHATVRQRWAHSHTRRLQSRHFLPNPTQLPTLSQKPLCVPLSTPAFQNPLSQVYDSTQDTLPTSPHPRPCTPWAARPKASASPQSCWPCSQKH